MREFEQAAGRAADDPGLRRRLDDIRADHPGCNPAAIAAVVRAVMTAMAAALGPREVELLIEVEGLGRTIAEARAQIADLEVGEITESQIPAATDELDAVVAHTALATDRILGVCETLDELATELSGQPAGDTLMAATTQIYEACGFQDITGQRISKVTGALKAIDEKVAQIVRRFGDRRRTAAVPEHPVDGTAAHGPQLPALAMAQSDIDQLMASFG